MPYIPPAAQQLVKQVTEHDADATYAVTGEPDGFGTHREIMFDPKTSKWLAPVLVAIEDERIAAMEERTKSKKKHLVVCFVADTRADFADEYPFDEVLEVFDEDEDQ